jgi:hypothetical protein
VVVVFGQATPNIPPRLHADRVGRWESGADHASAWSRWQQAANRLFGFRKLEERREGQHQPVRRSNLTWPALQIGNSLAIRSAGIGWRFHICFMKNVALIAQIVCPIRLHVAGVLRTGLTADNDPIDIVPSHGRRSSGASHGATDSRAMLHSGMDICCAIRLPMLRLIWLLRSGYPERPPPYAPVMRLAA